jgi:citrate lyase subunit beta/citryl-CoA lyase
VAWARRVLEATQDGAAQAVDGTMVDTPVRARAERILRDAALIRDPTDVHRRIS